jgi:hypothetical protein
MARRRQCSFLGKFAIFGCFEVAVASGVWVYRRNRGTYRFGSPSGSFAGFGTPTLLRRSRSRSSLEPM